jgi:hypothetical protein
VFLLRVFWLGLHSTLLQLPVGTCFGCVVVSYESADFPLDNEASADLGRGLFFHFQSLKVCNLLPVKYGGMYQEPFIFALVR